MPWLLQAISQFIPFTPFINAFTRITQMGAVLYDVIPQIMHLIILSLIGIIAVYFRMKYVLMHEPHYDSVDLAIKQNLSMIEN
jgi:ABC-2 type transport system permease protein